MSDNTAKWTEQDSLDLRLAAAEMRMLGQDDEADTLDRILNRIDELEGWKPIDDGAKTGDWVLLWCVHENAKYSSAPVAEGWEAPVVGRWINHNGGGFTWHGFCGVPTLYRPIAPPKRSEG